MRMAVVLGVLEGLPFAQLDDPELLRRVLREAVAAGRFSLLGELVHRFTPQGVTALALVGESHLALHSWPEHGVLFVDVASCTSLEAGRASFEAVAARFPGARRSVRETLYEGPAGGPEPGLHHLPPRPAP